ncbi:MAG: tetratricopeptide repeat protein [Nitrospirae bacterium]|nr:tetratricopeptide repeat protein [Nitrospirota bacterium]
MLSGVNISTRLIFALCPLLFALCFFSCATSPDSEDINRAEAHNKLGYSYFNKGQLNEAYLEFQKAILLNPDNKEALNQLGYINALYKKYDEAISFYKRAIKADPAYAEAMNNLGVLYVEMENWDEALGYFRAALNNPLYRSPEKAYTSMGYVHYRKEEYTLAEKALKDALMRNPVYPVANHTLGLVYVKLGDDSAAIEEFKKAIGIMPEYMDARWELAQAYLRAGEREKAVNQFRIISEKDSDVRRSREALEYIELIK